MSILFVVLLANAVVAAPASAVTTPGVTSEALGHDDRGRPEIGVMINDQGPFDMVVDTAAQTSLLTPGLAEELHLSPLASDMTINGATGRDKAQLYPVDHFTSQLFDQRQVILLQFPNPTTTNARGIVGMENFATGKLTFDRVASRITFGRSGSPDTGFVAHKGDVRDGSLLVVPLVLDGVTVKAMIDTGAGVSIANAAVLKELGWSATDPRLQDAGAIRGATSGASSIRVANMESFRFGPVNMRNVPLFFSTDNDPEPMVILGSDLLGLLDAYAIDFPRAELQIRIPPPSR